MLGLLVLNGNRSAPRKNCGEHKDCCIANCQNSNFLIHDFCSLMPAVIGAFVVSAANKKSVRVYGIVMFAHLGLFQSNALRKNRNGASSRIVARSGNFSMPRRGNRRHQCVRRASGQALSLGCQLLASLDQRRLLLQCLDEKFSEHAYPRCRSEIDVGQHPQTPARLDVTGGDATQ